MRHEFPAAHGRRERTKRRLGCNELKPLQLCPSTYIYGPKLQNALLFEEDFLNFLLARLPL